jgi:raffinose/stachyose/melibiose transport system permease protein
VLIIVYPALYSVWLSLFDWDGINPTRTFVGLDNYVTLWSSNRVFWIALKNSALWTAVALVVPTGLGLVLALMLNASCAAVRSGERSSIFRPSCRSACAVSSGPGSTIPRWAS